MRRRPLVCRSRVRTPSSWKSWRPPVGNFWDPPSHKRDLVREVRRSIIERLPTGSVGIDVIAEQLGMSSKTLERRLAQQGNSYSALLDRTRFNAVTHYLQDTNMRLAQVAYLAGFTEPAALVRAFKRWTGETPSKFRIRPRSAM
jgi:AraC-like DNA-binding protein